MANLAFEAVQQEEVIVGREMRVHVFDPAAHRLFEVHHIRSMRCRVLDVEAFDSDAVDLLLGHCDTWIESGGQGPIERRRDGHGCGRRRNDTALLRSYAVIAGDMDDRQRRIVPFVDLDDLAGFEYRAIGYRQSCRPLGHGPGDRCSAGWIVPLIIRRASDVKNAPARGIVIYYGCFTIAPNRDIIFRGSDVNLITDTVRA